MKVSELMRDLVEACQTAYGYINNHSAAGYVFERLERAEKSLPLAQAQEAVVEAARKWMIADKYDADAELVSALRHLDELEGK